MFQFRKRRQSAESETYDEQSGPSREVGREKTSPVTYSQLVKIANAVLNWLKRWLDAMAARISQRQDELAEGQAKVLEVLSEMKDRIMLLAEPRPVPEKTAEEGRDDAASPAPTIPAEEPSPDILKSLAMFVSQLDESTRHAQEAAEGCPKNCVARTLSQETAARMAGMRADVVSVLKMHGAELIDSAARFDASRHKPLGVVPRPEGAEGDGEVKRVGIVQRRRERDRVIKPASIVLYEVSQSQKERKEEAGE